MGRPAESPSGFICQTRDVLSARLARFSELRKVGLKEDDLPLVISIVGEVANNSFDHNLGQWRDEPGCWLQWQVTGGRLWICIADRGQGVLRSLSRVDPALHDDQTALLAAFEKNLSGRAPEKRGNGLKFVKNIIMAGEKRGVACRSGAGSAAYGRLADVCQEALSRFSSPSGQTATLILWSLQ